ncbi:MAG: type II 3-dehydroquinate dehydratase [Ignavibacteriales bacterium]|nr:type II 3-dehydroquinate dehydratase [Ignavibacteriales bacterium]
MRILTLNGPNLNRLGKRDASHYGVLTLEGIERALREAYPEDDFRFLQSNHEGELIDAIQAAEKDRDGVLINPGGYAHTSVAMRDALAECRLPKVEVHLSHLANREGFRQTLVTAQACDGYVSGFREKSYLAGVYLLKLLAEEGSVRT